MTHTRSVSPRSFSPSTIELEAGLVKDDLKTPVEGLVSRVDYRGVNPAVWFLYLEMYGKDSAQDLCRRVCLSHFPVSLRMQTSLMYSTSGCFGKHRRAPPRLSRDARWTVLYGIISTSTPPCLSYLLPDPE